MTMAHDPSEPFHVVYDVSEEVILEAELVSPGINVDDDAPKVADVHTITTLIP